LAFLKTAGCTVRHLQMNSLVFLRDILAA